MLQILGRTPDHDFDEPLGLLSDCHRRVERFLDLLIRIARDYAGRPLTPDAADALRTAQRYFADAAPKHTADEEESLFPRMQAAAKAQGQRCHAIDRLEGDHARAQPLHARVDALLTDYLRDNTLPPDRSTELSALLHSLRELYRTHIHVEDTEVFPLAATLLSAPDLAAVGSEMRARRGLPAPE